MDTYRDSAGFTLVFLARRSLSLGIRSGCRKFEYCPEGLTTGDSNRPNLACEMLLRLPPAATPKNPRG